MTHYLLDANHISPLVTKNHPLRERITDQMLAGDQFHIPALAVAEAMYGFLTIPRAVKNERQWRLIRPKFHWVDVYEEDVLEGTRLRVSLRKQGWQLDLSDAIIAATAIRSGLILLTTDRDFDGVPLLRTEDWRGV